MSYQNQNEAQVLTEAQENNIEQDIQDLKNKYPQYRFIITIEDNI